MNLNVHLVEAVGRYAGASGTILLLLAGVMQALLRFPGTPENKEKRISKLIWLTALFGVLAFLAAILQYQVGSHTPTSITENKTSGNLSPIIPNNCGSISITDERMPTGNKRK